MDPDMSNVREIQATACSLPGEISSNARESPYGWCLSCTSSKSWAASVRCYIGFIPRLDGQQSCRLKFKYCVQSDRFPSQICFKFQHFLRKSLYGSVLHSERIRRSLLTKGMSHTVGMFSISPARHLETLPSEGVQLLLESPPSSWLNRSASPGRIQQRRDNWGIGTMLELVALATALLLSWVYARRPWLNHVGIGGHTKWLPLDPTTKVLPDAKQTQL